MPSLFKMIFTKNESPEEDGQYSTDLGYIELFCGKWADVDEEPTWWMKEIELITEEEIKFFNNL